ncbi:hypothetical protein OH77DRAFT_1487130, partial [Trametes cingulata]
MDVLRTLLKVSRPAGWCFGPTLYAIGAIHGRGSARAPSLSLLLQLLSLSFPLALVVFGVNDVYDYFTDVHNPRKVADGLEGTVLPPTYHSPVILSACLASLCILVCSSFTGRTQNFVVTLPLLVLAWQYSAPPFRLKERPVFDSLSNGAIVVLAYLSGYTALGGSLRHIPPKGLVLGLCTAGVHALGAAVDAEADAAAGQHTIATALGQRGAVLFATLCYVAAVLAERNFSVFGVYLLGGLLMMVFPLVDVSRTHLAFRLVVCWTVGMSALWFADKALRLRRAKNG